MKSATEKPTVRQLIEDAISAAKGDVRQVAVNVCVILEDEFIKNGIRHLRAQKWHTANI